MMKRYVQEIRDFEGLLQLRRDFRRNPTKAEALLWGKLRSKRLEGHKFRRQHAIGRYIVDFYHAQTKTIIEVDGSIHHDAEVKEYDQMRQNFLEDLGYIFLRFSNDEVIRDIDFVLCSILKHLKTFKSPSLAKEG